MRATDPYPFPFWHQTHEGSSEVGYLFQVYPNCDPNGVARIGHRIGRELVVGRFPTPPLGFSGGQYLRVFDGLVSRWHFRIVHTPSGLFVEDLGAKNGTFVDGWRVLSCAVQQGSQILAGDTCFLLVEEPPALDVELAEKSGFVACSASLRKSLQSLEAHLRCGANVLILGETGTGKDGLAKVIHLISRRQGEFVPVNCAHLADSSGLVLLYGSDRGLFTGVSARTGLVQRAHGGTLFLNEISEASTDVQALMLDFLDTRCIQIPGTPTTTPVDVQVIAATNRHGPFRGVSHGLRPDLYQRLKACVVHLPPLRERKEDILPIAFNHVRGYGLDPERVIGNQFAMALLLHDWPGNVRELLLALNSCLARIQPRKEALNLHSLLEILGASLWQERGTDLRDEKPTSLRHLELMLQTVGGNRTELARRIQVPRQQVYRWQKELAALDEP